MNVKKYLQLAAKVSRLRLDRRDFFIGAVAIRGDGTLICASNGNQNYPTPTHHAETRIVRKVDRHATVFVARTRADNSLALAKPCPDCERMLRKAYVKKVYYTIDNHNFGCLTF